MYASLLPSTERSHYQAMIPAGFPSPLIFPVAASNGSDQIRVASVRVLKARFLPFGEIVRSASSPAPVVSCSGQHYCWLLRLSWTGHDTSKRRPPPQSTIEV